MMPCRSPIATPRHSRATGCHLRNASGKPGAIVWVASVAASPGNPVGMITALTELLQPDTPVWIDPTLPLAARYAGQCASLGARPVALTEARVAILSPASVSTLSDLVARAITVVMEVPALTGGLTLRLRDASGGAVRDITPQLPPALLSWLRADPAPRQLDWILTSGDALLSLPPRVGLQVC
ncbi:phosphonate C-P lyase system protein PhnH [Pantoea sp. 1.19]|uniref:phosphonate C-P lyase system protein PhnH n=1 Tax=Pantoea sp. 1.19 TaxID=1925589 RepID=UPI000949144C|nr:phosphonate C-P lyase system protein PhnH [Pantoea sp. 1.19]